jgi:hypothetical protein
MAMVIPEASGRDGFKHCVWLIVSFHKVRHRQEIGGPAWAEPALDKVLVHRLRMLSPIGPADATLVEKLLSRAACKQETWGTAAMKQISVFDSGDEREA